MVRGCDASTIQKQLLARWKPQKYSGTVQHSYDITTFLLCYLLRYCFTAVLLYCGTALLRYCFTAVLTLPLHAPLLRHSDCRRRAALLIWITSSDQNNDAGRMEFSLFQNANGYV